MLVILSLILINILFSQVGSPESILDSVLNKLAPDKTMGIVKQINKYPNKSDRIFKYEYYADNIEDSQLIKYIYPNKIKNNSFLLKNNGKDIWAYFSRTRRTRKLASHITKRGMQDSEFTFQDLSKNRDWLTEYDIKIGNFNEKLFIINLFLKEDITSDYSKIEIYVDNKNYYPTKIIYYYDNRSEAK